MLKNKNQVIDFIQEAKVGKLSNIFLNSQAFINAMRHIHLDQSDQIRFRFNLKRLNLRLLNSIISVEPIYTTNNLVVVVKIPLATGNFELFKLTSLQLRYDRDLFYFVKTNNDYLAIDEDKQRYIFLSKSDLTQCIRFQETDYLCQQSFIFYSFTVQNCIIKLLNGEVKPDNCDVQIFRLNQEIWFNLLESNAWIYIYSSNKNEHQNNL